MLLPHPCTDFLNQFLTKRNLVHPTGTSLYSYKTTRPEYETLKTLLTKMSPASSTSACFVLFAAEWWRRNYSGGHWEWEPIFNEIDRPEWNSHAIRDRMMSEGCRYWGRQIFQHGNGANALLGTLFFEAGLPVHLLTNEGYIRGLMLKSFSFLQTYRTQSADTIVCIRDLARSIQLPNALNVDAFYELIYQVINPLLDFKNAHQLGERQQPLLYLNEHVPNWRDELPLRIDDDPNARTFLDSLLIDVAKIAKQEVSRIGLNHSLSQVADGWKVTTTLSIPDGFYTPENLQLSAEIYASVVGKMAIKIHSSNQERLIGHGFKAGNGKVSIKGLSAYVLPADSHQSPWTLVFAGNRTDQEVAIKLPYADGLDPRLPWVFTQLDEGDPVLKGVGSVRLSAETAWLVCPDDFVIEGPEGATTHRGQFADGQTVYSVTATCVLRDIRDDHTFCIRLAQPIDDNYYLALYPQSNNHYLDFCQKQNAGIFLGFPRIRKQHKLGGMTLSDRDSIQFKPNAQSGWQPVRNGAEPIGRYKIRQVGPEGEVLFCREIAVLPKNFGVRFDAVNQQILLDNTAAFRISVYHEGTTFDPQIQSEGTGHRIAVEAGSQGDRLKLRLTSGTTRDIILHVPFPAAAGHFTDAEGHVMSNNQSVDLKNLPGVHLILNSVSVQHQTNQLTLTLLDKYNREASYTLSKTLQISPSARLEVSLMRYHNDIERLLSFTGTVDAVVRIQLNGGTSICVSQYTHQASYNHQTGTITPKGDAPFDVSIRLQAFPLFVGFAKPYLVDLEYSEDGWKFPDSALPGGKWFYFSTKESMMSVRPSIAKRAEQIDEDFKETVAELHEATNFSHENRHAVLTNLFDRIGTDFADVNWTTLDHLHTHIQHVPLCALDVWKALTRSNQGLVAFFLRFDSVAIGKLSRAFSVSWPAIPVTAWLAGFQSYRDSLPDTVAELVIDQKIQELESGFSLGSLAEIIRTAVLDASASPDFQMCQHIFCIQPIIADELMGRQGHMGLIQKHKGHQFPTYLSRELIGGFDRLPAAVRQLLPDIPSHFRYIRPVAYLPVLLAYQSVYPDKIDLRSLNRHQVTQLIDFDDEFFNLIYNLVQAFCWLN